MLARLGRVVREARLAADKHQIDVATAAGVSHSTISRFETGERWPRDVDGVIAAYAAECKVDVDKLWAKALALLVAESLLDR